MPPPVASAFQNAFNSIQRVKDHPSSWQPGIVKNTCCWWGGSSRCHECQMQMTWFWLLQAATPAMALLDDTSLNENGIFNLHHKWLAAYCTCLALQSCAGHWFNKCLTWRHVPICAGIIKGVTLQLLFALRSVTALYGYKHSVRSNWKHFFEEHDSHWGMIKIKDLKGRFITPWALFLPSFLSAMITLYSPK